MKEYEFHLSNILFINIRVNDRDSEEKNIERARELATYHGIIIPEGAIAVTITGEDELIEND